MSEPSVFDIVCDRVEHGGNVYAASRSCGRPLERFCDFSASINPLGLPASARRAIVQALPRIVHYPDPEHEDLRHALGTVHGVDPSCVVLGNGSIELIHALPRALGIRHGLVLGPTFSEYERGIRLAGGQCTYVHATPVRDYAPPLRSACRVLRGSGKKVGGRGQMGRGRPLPPIDAVFLCHPNSPTGRALTREDVVRLSRVAGEAGAWLVIDEAFIGFCEHHSVIGELRRWPHLVLLRSFTKFYAMPGVRIGYLLAEEQVARRISAVLPPWSVNALAQVAALAALHDDSYRRRSLALMNRERKRLFERLRKLPYVRVVPSSANFLFIELGKGSVSSLATALKRRGILVRDCTTFPGIRTQALRVAIRRPPENDRLLRALRAAVAEGM